MSPGPVPTPQTNLVPPASMAPNKLVPCGRSMRQLAENRQRELLVLSRLQHHEYRHAKQRQFGDAIDVKSRPQEDVEGWPQHPIRDQPRHKQIESLESVE